MSNTVVELPKHKVITVKEAQQIRGMGVQIHWRPDGVISKTPDNDKAFLIFGPSEK